MSYYSEGIRRIKEECYSNEHQIAAVVAMKQCIDRSFGDDLNLALLAGTCHTSKFHLLRLFKKYYGQTPRQYLIDKRLEKAKCFLKQGGSVSDACFAVGFESPSSFSRLFKHKTGLSPLVFQKKQFSQSGSGLPA